MTIADLLARTLQKEKDMTLTTQQIYQDNQLLSKGTIRSALSRMRKKGIVERVGRGIYQLVEEIFREFTHAKRVTGTNKKSPKHDFNGDVEMTCRGLAPGTATLEEVDDVVNPKLLDQTFIILEDEGISLYEAVTDYEVIGTEQTTFTSETYNSLWNVTVKYTNDEGVMYVFDGFMEVAESEWR